MCDDDIISQSVINDDLSFTSNFLATGSGHKTHVLQLYMNIVPYCSCPDVKCSSFFSLFIMTNETINVWTHILGFLIFFILSIHANFIIIPAGEGGYRDHMVFTCYLLFYQVGFTDLYNNWIGYTLTKYFM